MLSRVQLRTLSILALVAAFAQANWFESNILGRQEGLQVRRGLVGALVGGLTSDVGDLTGASATDSSAGTSTSSTSASKTSSTTTTSSTPVTTSSTTPVTSSTPVSTPADTTTSSTSTTDTSSDPTQTSSSETDTSTSDSSTKTSTSATTTKSSKLVTSTHPATTEVVVVTNTVNGQTQLSSYTTTSAASTSTGLLQDDSTTKSSGMSSKTKSTVIGVVVGIGGFAILAGLGVVAFKIWGRRKNEEEGDELMSNLGGREKDSSAGSGPSNPFQSTLDQYHAPGRVNASSNF